MALRTLGRLFLGRTMHTNRLSGEKSPYLLQHKHNPINWYPWGEEALQLAKQDNRPIFLSIGYSTCHWCHVMEEESFTKYKHLRNASDEVAKVLNDNFVSIKVDREERPDVEGQYMIFVQAMAGSRGWPMSIFLTPDLKPFFAGMYFPPEDHYGQPSFRKILETISNRWREDPSLLCKSGDKLVKNMQEALQVVQAATLEETSEGNRNLVIAHKTITTFLSLHSSYDEEYGGFGGPTGPKFPTACILEFLLYLANLGGSLKVALERTDSYLHSQPQTLKALMACFGLQEENQANQELSKSLEQKTKLTLAMVTKTLKCMWTGGIHDHIAGGFHRYSVDRIWHVPHFEKMLNDQAQLLSIYSRAFQLTKDQAFQETITDIVGYLRETLLLPSGAFCGGEDADSLPTHDSTRKKEGAFAVWKMEEIEEILGVTDAAIFCDHFGVEKAGNVDPMHDIQGELNGLNVLMVQDSVKKTAERFSLSVEECECILQKAKQRLADRRKQRPKPALEDKILMTWNALTISGLCRAFEATGKEEYLQMAKKTMKFLTENMFGPDCTVRRVYREGTAYISGFADDYAFLIAALIDLYEATLIEEYLEMATKLQRKMDQFFWDSQHGGYFSEISNHPNSLFRIKDTEDGAEPSTNSVCLMNLVRLSYLMSVPESKENYYGQRLEKQLNFLLGQSDSLPAALSAALFKLVSPWQVTLQISSSLKDDPHGVPNVSEMLTAIRTQEPIFKTIKAQLHDDLALCQLQICRGTQCFPPIKDPAQVVNSLQSSIT